MKIEKQFKILAYVLTVLIFITALLSMYFVMYPFVVGVSAPKIILDILTVLNLLIPSVGIISMLIFIFTRKKS